MSDDFEDITPAEQEGKIVAKLMYDECAENPRQNYDHAGILHLESRDYDLSDSASGLPYHWSGNTPTQRTDIEVCARAIGMFGGVAIPVRFEDYGSSGARIHETDAENANGLIWIEKDKIEQEWTAHGTPDPIAAARACLESEISEMDSYLQGDVYGYVIETPEGEHLDSCWGFIGRTYAEEEGATAAAHAAETVDNRAAALYAARCWAFSAITRAAV